MIMLSIGKTKVAKEEVYGAKKQKSGMLMLIIQSSQN